MKFISYELSDYKSLKYLYRKQFQCSAVYIFVFEILHRFIIEKVQGFFYDYEHGKKVVCEENKKFFTPKYKVFSCCTNFLIEADIIGKKDQTFLNNCRRTRNKLAHNFAEVLAEQFADLESREKN